MLKRIISFLFVLLVFTSALTVSAAEPKARTYIDGPKSITVGNEFEITIYAEGDSISAIMGKLQFNPDIMEYLSIKSVVEGGWKVTSPQVVDGTFQYACADEKKKGKALITEKTAVMTITFKALADAENFGFTITEQQAFCVTNVLDSSGKLVVVENTEFPPASHSNNEASSSQQVSDTSSVDEVEETDNEDNLLESLIVKNATLTPAFSPEIKEYNVAVSTAVERLDIEVKAKSDKATIKITGDELEFFEKKEINVTEITVISETGPECTYRINTRLIDLDAKNNKNESNADDISWIWIGIIGSVVFAIVLVVIISVRKQKHNTCKY